jgi:dTDP-D-glucose 4,6-dehydratase
MDGSDPKSVHEATYLSLSIEKAGAWLDWHPAWSFSEAIKQTVNWYHQRHALRSQDMRAFSCQQIQDYAAAAGQQGLAWTK